MAFWRRGYNWEEVEYIEAPTGGWNPDAQPWELQQNQASVLDNVLIEPGKVVARGPVTVVNDLTAQAPLNVCGSVVGNNWCRLTQKAVSAAAYIDHWNVPLLKPTVSTALAKATAVSVYVPFGGGQTALGNNPVGPRSINFGGLIYGVTYDAQLNTNLTANDIQSTYLCWRNHLYTIPVGAGSGTNVTAFLNAPQGAFDIASYLNRIWLLGGIDTPAGAIQHSPIKLFFTIPIVSGAGNAATDWRDPVSGLTNQIVLNGGDQNDYGVGLGVARNALVIFRRNSIEALRGNLPANFYIATVSREVGCIDARSIVECDRGVYFLSHKGLMLTDGVTIRNLTGEGSPVTYTLNAAISAYLGAQANSFGGWAEVALLSDGKLLISIGINTVTAAAPDGHITPIWCAIYDPLNGTWVRLTSNVWSGDATQTVAGNNYPGHVLSNGIQNKFVVGDKYVTQLESSKLAGSFSDSRASANNQIASSAQTTDDGTVTNAWIVGSKGSPARSSFGFVRIPKISNIAWASNVWTVNPAFTGSVTPPAAPFQLPAGATVQGILVELTRNCTSTYSLAANLHDSQVQLSKAGVAVGTNKAVTTNGWPITPPGYTTFGGPADLWGTTWTPTEINQQMGLKLAVAGTTLNPTTLYGYADVNSVTITVYYTIAGGGVQAQSMVRTVALYDVGAGAALTPIPVAWKTRYVPIRGTGTRKYGLAKRYFLDYALGGSGLSSTNAWQTVPVGPDDNPLDSITVHAAGGTPTATGSVSGAALLSHPRIQRKDVEFVMELDDTGFNVTWADSAPPSAQPGNTVAEIYGVGLEFQPSYERR